MKKIGFSSFVLQGGRTGVATYIVNLLNHLKELDKENKYEVMVPECDRHLLPKSGGNFQQLTVASCLTGPIWSIIWHNTILPLLTDRLDFDILHIPTYRRVPRFKKCKVVATVHDLAPLTLEKKYDAARTFYNVRLVPRLLRHCDHLITVSHCTKQDILHFVGVPEEKISVIYPGIDRETFQPMDKAKAVDRLHERYGLDDPFMVYVSRVEHPAKNHIALIKAFEVFKLRNYSSHKLVLAGAYWPGADEVFQFARTSPVRDEIMFLGFVPTQDIVALYSCCDLTVHPSLFEGFGFPVIEAAACGSPVISADTSSLSELCKGYFPLFDPRNPEDMCHSMEYCLSSYGEKERQRGMAYAASFDWSKTARAVAEVYNHVGE